MKILPRGLGLASVLASTLLLASASAQTPNGRDEVVTTEPALAGLRANAPIPVSLHVRNEGGSDEAGLCVTASTLCNGMYQRIPALAGGKQSAYWLAAKSRPGGSYPAKLEAFLKEQLPDEKWVSWEGRVTDLIEPYNRRGLPVAVTINTGEMYGWQPIHHFVSLVHIDGALACYVDNNDPGRYHWITRAEFDRRFVDGDKGWFVVFLRSPDDAAHLWSASALLLICSAGLLEWDRRTAS